MTGTILAVEDNDTDFMALRCALKSAGIKNPIERYENGHAAYERILASHDRPNVDRVCLILLDLNIPGVDGRQLLRDFRARDPKQSVPVIVLTASSRHQDIEECRTAGANAYVIKPLELEEWESQVGPVAEFWLASVRADGDLDWIGKHTKKTKVQTDQWRLTRTIECAIIPSLMLASRLASPVEGEPATQHLGPGAADVFELTRLLLVHDVSVARSYIDVFIGQGTPLAEMLVTLLEPAEKHISDLWKSDMCDTSEYLEIISRFDDLIEQLTTNNRPYRLN
jgi:two-component system response regulator